MIWHMINILEKYCLIKKGVKEYDICMYRFGMYNYRTSYSVI